jgi:hypothetical protein
VVSELEQVGITVAATSDDSAVTASDATKGAIAGVPLLDGAKSSAASLVTFTDTHSGKVGSDGSVDPTYVDREAWIVIFSNSPMPLFGPAGTKSGFYDSDTAVLVDAKTGVFLEAIAFGSHGG